MHVDGKRLAEVQDALVMPLTTLYRCPSRLATDAAADLYLQQWVETIASVGASRAELLAAWAQVRREWRSDSWMPPGVVCQAIETQRKEAAEDRRARVTSEKPADKAGAAALYARADAVMRTDVGQRLLRLDIGFELWHRVATGELGGSLSVTEAMIERWKRGHVEFIGAIADLERGDHPLRASLLTTAVKMQQRNEDLKERFLPDYTARHIPAFGNRAPVSYRPAAPAAPTRAPASEMPPPPAATPLAEPLSAF